MTRKERLVGFFKYFLPSTRRAIEAAHASALKRHAEATARIDILCERLGREPQGPVSPAPTPEPVVGETRA